MAKLGDIEFNVLTESRPFSNEVTQYPVEVGSDIIDHVKPNLRTFDISGIVGDDENPASIHNRLGRLSDSGKVVKYVGRGRLDACIVEDFTPSVSVDSKKGFRFTLTLIEVKITKPSTVSLLPIRLKVDMAAIGNAGRVQTK